MIIDHDDDDDDDDDDHIAFAGLDEGGVGTDFTVCLQSTYVWCFYRNK